MEQWEFYWDGLRTVGEWSSQPKYEGMIGVIYDWQTLISGILALIAGGAVYAQLRLQRMQLEDDRKKHSDQMKRQERAARIKIPHALANLTDFIEKAYASWLLGELRKCTLPHTPVQTLMAVSEAIDHLSYKTVRDVVSELQVFESRHLNKETNFHPGQVAIDLAKLKYQVDRLFDFGRMATDAPIDLISPSNNEIRTILHRAKTDLILKGFTAKEVEARFDSALALIPNNGE